MMNLYQCQEWAKDNGFDRAEFIAMFPAGPKKCKWLDAHFGLFQIDVEDKPMVRVKEIDEKFPTLICAPLLKEDEDA